MRRQNWMRPTHAPATRTAPSVAVGARQHSRQCAARGGHARRADRRCGRARRRACRAAHRSGGRGQRFVVELAGRGRLRRRGVRGRDGAVAVSRQSDAEPTRRRRHAPVVAVTPSPQRAARRGAAEKAVGGGCARQAKSAMPRRAVRGHERSPQGRRADGSSPRRGARRRRERSRPPLRSLLQRWFPQALDSDAERQQYWFVLDRNGAACAAVSARGANWRNCRLADRR